MLLDQVRKLLVRVPYHPATGLDRDIPDRVLVDLHVSVARVFGLVDNDHLQGRSLLDEMDEEVRRRTPRRREDHLDRPVHHHWMDILLNVPLRPPVPAPPVVPPLHLQLLRRRHHRLEVEGFRRQTLQVGDIARNRYNVVAPVRHLVPTPLPNPLPNLNSFSKLRAELVRSWCGVGVFTHNF